MWCITAAATAAQARMQAMENGSEYGIDWEDPMTVRCESVTHTGGPMPPEDYRSFPSEAVSGDRDAPRASNVRSAKRSASSGKASAKQFFGRLARVVMHHKPLALALLVDVGPQCGPSDLLSVFHLPSDLSSPATQAHNTRGGYENADHCCGICSMPANLAV